MIHADHALAHRLESLICAEYRRLAEVGRAVCADAGAWCIEVAGGVALRLGEGSPVNTAVGLGRGSQIREAEQTRALTPIPAGEASPR